MAAPPARSTSTRAARWPIPSSGRPTCSPTCASARRPSKPGPTPRRSPTASAPRCGARGSPTRSARHHGSGMRFSVEPSPAGGYFVRVAGVDAPVSRHDTEEDAEAAAASYGRAVEDDRVGDVARLRDGGEGLGRAVRPEDKPLFARGWERFGEESRYRRFMGAKQRLTTSELSFFTEIDHIDHEALGALDPGSGEGLGVARYVRSRPPPR